MVPRPESADAHGLLTHWGLGARKLQALTAVEVERFYARLVNKGGPAGRPLAAKTVRNTHIVLHRALADAERLRLVMRNVAHLARPPSVPHVERATWTAEELAAFLEHVSGDRLFAAYVLLATTGMRRGEVFGLRATGQHTFGVRASRPM